MYKNKISELEKDVDTFLQQLINCLFEVKPPDYKNIVFQLPTPLLSEIIKKTLEPIIAEMRSRKHPELSEHTIEAICQFFDYALKQIQERTNEFVSEDE